MRSGVRLDFGRFFDCVLEEMNTATFSYSVFTRRNGVPKARETLRNIAAFLIGKPTKQFLAETWKQRIREYLETKNKGTPETFANAINTPQQTKSRDIDRSGRKI